MDLTLQRKLDKVNDEIETIARVLSRTSDDDPNLSLLLCCLANAHDKRFDFLEEPDDIEKVIEYRSIVLTMTPDDLIVGMRLYIYRVYKACTLRDLLPSSTSLYLPLPGNP